MASKCIKLEDSDDDGDVGVTAHTSTAPKDRSHLFQLNAEQSEKLGYPIGCPILYGFRSVSKNSCGGMATTDIREGIVKSLALNMTNRGLDFEIERRNLTDGNNGKSSALVQYASENDVAYAIGSPVLVAMCDNLESTDATSKAEKVEGKVLFVKPFSEPLVKGKNIFTMSYTVQYSIRGGRRVRFEEGVIKERLSYNGNGESNAQVEEEGRPLVANELQQNNAPTPALVQNSSENGSQADGKMSDSAPMGNLNKKSNNGNKSFDEHERHMMDPTCHIQKSSELYVANEKSDIPRDPVPQADVYVQKPMEQRTSSSEFASSQFDGATSPLTCDISDSGVDKQPIIQQRQTNFQLAQHKKINFQPPPLKKRPYDEASSTQHNTDIPNESHGKVSRTEHQSSTRSRGSATFSDQPQNHAHKQRELECQLTVPLWVLDSEKQLFFHLIGPGGRKTNKIHIETGCKVHCSRYSKANRTPMKITIKVDPEYEQCADMAKAINLVDRDLRNFYKESRADKRLRYELRAGSATQSLLPQGKSGAVQIGSGHWLQLVEMPCIPQGYYYISGKRALLRQDLVDRIKNETQCNATVFANHPAPLKSCNPYVAVTGRFLHEVDTATAIITNATTTGEEKIIHSRVNKPTN